MARQDRLATRRPRPQDQPAESPITLNVIFHGLFVFVVWDQCVEVLIPTAADHIYQAGNWMRVQDRLAKGAVYQLRGVAAGTPQRFAPDRNLVLSNLRIIDRSPSRLHCSMLLPFPNNIWSLRCVPERPAMKFFSGTAATHISPAAVALTQVFVYSDFDPRALALEPGFKWTPEANSQNAINLHVHAECADPLHVSKSHPVMAVRSAASLLPGIELNLKYSDHVEPDPSNVRPYGVDLCEELGLREPGPARLCQRHAPAAQPPVTSPGAAPRKRKGADIVHCMALVVNNTE